MPTTKDLVNLLQILQTSRQSGELLVEPLEQGEIAWQGWFQLRDGQIVSCLVLNKADGQILQRDDEAMQWLTNPLHGKLEWSLKEVSQAPSDGFLPLLSPHNDMSSNGRTSGRMPSVQPPSQYTPPPVRHNPPAYHNPPMQYPKAQLEMVLKRTGRGMYTSGDILPSREHRQIFSLIDGRRTVIELARLLHKPPEVVLQILNDLVTMGLIG